MTVLLCPPLTRSSPWGSDRRVEEALTHGPAYVRTRTATRWHRVRSAVFSVSDYRGTVEERTTYHHWCGTFSSTFREVWTTDTPPAGEPRCGTCEGRAIGADPERPEWLFAPRNLTSPKLCPSGTARGRGNRSLWAETDRWNRIRCLVCGDIVPGRASGGPYASIWGPQSHEPGPGLIDPCPFHGWDELVGDHATTAACRCGETGRWPTTRPLPPGSTTESRCTDQES